MEETQQIFNESDETAAAAAAETREGSECRSESEEYEIISNPTGSDKLIAIVGGEATLKRNKRRNRKRKNDNESQFHSQHAFPIDTDIEENKMIETVQAVTCRTEGNGDKAGSMEVNDVCSLSSVDDDGLIWNISYGTSTRDMVSAEGTLNVDGEMISAEETVDAGMKEMHAEKDKCVESVKSPKISAKNIVLRNHHKPRYFDPPNDNFMLQKTVKARILHRNLLHVGKPCSQGQYCFVCRGTFHHANDCPKKQEENNLYSIVCLRCGDSGHDMFSCASDYFADDLKKIRCYICNDFGHLSCVKLPNTSPTEVSCYKCGQSGHAGSDCSKFPKVGRGSKSPVLCYRCREEGHFARTCTLPRKHARKVHAEMRSLGSSTVPPSCEPQNDDNDTKGETQDGVIMKLSLTTSKENQGRIHDDSCNEQPLSVVAKGETQDGVIMKLSLTTSEENQGRIHDYSCNEQPLSVVTCHQDHSIKMESLL